MAWEINNGRAALSAAEKANEAAREAKEISDELQLKLPIIDDANAKSEEALNIAQNANNKSDQAITTANNIIANAGDSNTEIVNGRQRLNGSMAENIGTHIREIEKISNLRGYIKYGEIKLPDDFFNNISFSLYRDVDKKVKHTFDIVKKIENYSRFYVSENGLNTNGGLTPETPWKSMTYAINKIESDVNIKNARITIVSNKYSRDNIQINSKILTKNYCIECISDKNILGTYNTVLPWVTDGTVYKSSRSSVTAIFDSSVRKIYDMPTQYKKVASIDQCKNQKGSWYTNGPEVWVNTLSGNIPDDNVYVCINVVLFNLNLAGSASVIFKDLNLLNGYNSSAIKVVSDDQSGQFITYNTRVLCGDGTGSNAVESVGVKYTWHFKLLCHNAGRDGINYHTNSVDVGGETFAFEYDCLSFDNGLRGNQNNNNASTAHDGMRILRVGTIGYNCNGPILVDVNGCYSILIDCSAIDSILPDSPSTKAGFYFDNSVSNLSTQPDGKAILINCEGGGIDTLSISSDKSFKNNKISVLNFVGNNIPYNMSLNFIE